MNHKNARIAKLHRQGLSVDQIIKKIGHLNTPDIVHRIERIIERLNEGVTKTRTA